MQNDGVLMMRLKCLFYIYNVCVCECVCVCGGGGVVSVFIADMFALQESYTCINVNSFVLFMTFDIHR